MRGDIIRVSAEEINRQKEFSEEIRNMPHRPATYHVVTYGCQMNAHDSEKLAGMLEEMGMTKAAVKEEADFVLFNTCCIRENAERKALGNVTWLNEVRKKRPEMIIGVCGCMVQEPGMAERIMWATTCMTWWLVRRWSHRAWCSVWTWASTTRSGASASAWRTTAWSPRTGAKTCRRPSQGRWRILRRL